MNFLLSFSTKKMTSGSPDWCFHGPLIPREGAAPWGSGNWCDFFARCLEASCHIELSICLCLETPEMLQEGVARREFKLSTCHRSGEEQNLWRVPSPLWGAKRVGFVSYGPLWKRRFMSHWRQEIVFNNCRSNLDPASWTACSSGRQICILFTRKMYPDPWIQLEECRALVENNAHWKRKPRAQRDSSAGRVPA